MRLTEEAIDERAEHLMRKLHITGTRGSRLRWWHRGR